jgi:putative membrane protein
MGNVKRMGGVLLASAAMAMAACGGNKDNTAAAGDSAAAASAGTGGAGTGTAAGSTAPAGAGGPATPGDSAKGAVAQNGNTSMLTDPDIVSLTQASDEGEIATSKIAVQKATSADVKRYAQQMLDHHSKMIQSRNALLKTNNMQAAAGAKDSAAKVRDQMVSMLNQAPKGVAFDTAYVNGQVLSHTNTLQMVRNAEPVAKDPGLKGMLQKAAPAIEKHLEEAKALQSKLGGGAAQ